jgi:autotransporter-associated beta strand protein
VDSSAGTATVAQFGNNGGAVTTTMEFSSDSVTGTSGSLTIANVNNTNNTAVSFKTLFSGQGFNFSRPIIISDSVLVGTGVKSNELQGGNTTGTQTFSGAISGGGSLRRVNAGGTTILSGLNSYTGTTSVDAGTLSITNPYLADGADVRLITGGIFDLNFAGTDTISRLFFDGVSQAIGTYGATGSGATFINDTFFTGSGVLNVTVFPGSGSGLDGAGTVPEPGSLSLMIFAISSALISCSRRLNRRRS